MVKFQQRTVAWIVACVCFALAALCAVAWLQNFSLTKKATDLQGDIDKKTIALKNLNVQVKDRDAKVTDLNTKVQNRDSRLAEQDTKLQIATTGSLNSRRVPAAIGIFKGGDYRTPWLPVQEGGRETALGLCPGNSDSLRIEAPPSS